MVQNVHIFIVSAVKIYKRCLQLFQLLGDFVFQTTTEASPLDSTGGFPSPDTLGYSLPM